MGKPLNQRITVRAHLINSTLPAPYVWQILLYERTRQQHGNTMLPLLNTRNSPTEAKQNLVDQAFHSQMARKQTKLVPQAIGVAIVLAGLGLGYWYMTPDADHGLVRSNVDRGQNAAWLQHGWLGDDHWFEENRRDKTLFRSEARVKALADTLAAHHVTDLFPHLCPCSSDGRIAEASDDQVELFLRAPKSTRRTSASFPGSAVFLGGTPSPSHRSGGLTLSIPFVTCSRPIQGSLAFT